MTDELERMAKPHGLTNQHHEFRKRAATAFLDTADDPDARFEQLTGSLPALKECLSNANVRGLAHNGSGKDYGEEPTLAMTGDKWSLTPFGANRYRDYLEAARKSRTARSSRGHHGIFEVPEDNR